MEIAESRTSMLKYSIMKAGALCLLGMLTVSGLVYGRKTEMGVETITHTTSARVSMLRRGRQETSNASPSSPLQQVSLCEIDTICQ